jgi:hypothetical protein
MSCFWSRKDIWQHDKSYSTKALFPGFGATVEIYDSVENRITWKAELGDKPVSLSFESNAGSIYFIAVTSYDYGYTGDYELIVRKE